MTFLLIAVAAVVALGLAALVPEKQPVRVAVRRSKH